MQAKESQHVKSKVRFFNDQRHTAQICRAGFSLSCLSAGRRAPKNSPAIHGSGSEAVFIKPQGRQNPFLKPHINFTFRII